MRRTRIAVFGYGSLVDPGSASSTLGRPVEDAIPARLSGWRRRWSQARDNLKSEKTFALTPGGNVPPYVLALNVEIGEDDAGAVNGVLIELTAAELDRLDIREIRYNRVEVAASIEVADGDAPFDTIVTYSAKEQNFAPSAPDGAVILSSYASVVERAFATLGRDEVEVYRRTTGPHPAPIVEAELVRDRIPHGNPRAW